MASRCAVEETLRGGRLAHDPASNRATEVVRWSWSEAQITCAEGTVTSAGRFTLAMKVRGKRLAGTGFRDEEGGRARTRGRFRKSFRKTKGTFPVTGGIPEGGTNCSTRKLRWKVSRR